jgi:hypothetical protein
VVFGLTFSHPPADFATLLVCWLVWWLHQNLRSLICASAGRTQQQMPKPRQCSTLAAIFRKFLMVELSEIINFVEKHTGADNVSENSDLTKDIGVDGDDFDELINEFAKKYNVDISSCLWYFHCSEEGSWNSIGRAFFKSPNNRVIHIPVTPLMLFGFTKVGKWNLEYPEHKLPKKRYDIIINNLLILICILFLLYKCAS